VCCFAANSEQLLASANLSSLSPKTDEISPRRRDCISIDSPKVEIQVCVNLLSRDGHISDIARNSCFHLDWNFQFYLERRLPDSRRIRDGNDAGTFDAAEKPSMFFITSVLSVTLHELLIF